MIGERIKAREGAARARSSASAARSAARASATTTLPRLAGRLHQRRQVDAVQRAGQGARPTRPTSCSRRSTPRRASCTSTSAGSDRVAVRHGRLHPRPAAQAGRGVRGHAAGGGRRRPAAARRRLRRARCSTSRCAEVERVLAEIGAADVPQIARLQQARRLEPTSGRASARRARARRRRVPRVFVSARSGEGLALAGRARATVAVDGRGHDPRARRRIARCRQLIGTIPLTDERTEPNECKASVETISGHVQPERRTMGPGR